MHLFPILLTRHKNPQNTEAKNSLQIKRKDLVVLSNTDLYLVHSFIGLFSFVQHTRFDFKPFLAYSFIHWTISLVQHKC